MPDHRKHRGPHPEDKQLFADTNIPRLREAASDLAWLFNRGYASTSALKIVGDRYELVARQRTAVARCTCSDQAADRRKRHEISAEQLAGHPLWIDGYNVLTSLEAALSGGVILYARDGCYRDMASMHGSYRKVEETIPALHILGELLADWKVSECRWLFDQPVSNSGRLKTILQNLAVERKWNWRVVLVPDPDRDLIATDQIVASSDSQILDNSDQWFNLARLSMNPVWKMRGSSDLMDRLLPRRENSPWLDCSNQGRRVESGVDFRDNAGTNGPSAFANGESITV